MLVWVHKRAHKIHIRIPTYDLPIHVLQKSIYFSHSPNLDFVKIEFLLFIWWSRGELYDNWEKKVQHIYTSSMSDSIYSILDNFWSYCATKSLFKKFMKVTTYVIVGIYLNNKKVHKCFFVNWTYTICNNISQKFVKTYFQFKRNF